MTRSGVYRVVGVVFLVVLAAAVSLVLGSCARSQPEAGLSGSGFAPRPGAAQVPRPGGVGVGPQAGAQAQGDDARAFLKAMSDYMGSQQTIQLEFDSDIEIITPQLEKIQFTNSGWALLSRPDKLHGYRVGGYAEVELIFDGKTAVAFDRGNNRYLQKEAPGTVDQLIEALHAGDVVSMPGADFLTSNSYDVLTADVQEAKYMGRGVIDGVECEHLAFRNFDTDWQLWLEVGERPIPRKVVITSKTISGSPQYTIRIKSFQTGVQPPADAFTFVPPEGAQQLSPDDLIGLDELPPGAPRGGN